MYISLKNKKCSIFALGTPYVFLHNSTRATTVAYLNRAGRKSCINWADLRERTRNRLHKYHLAICQVFLLENILYFNLLRNKIVK